MDQKLGIRFYSTYEKILNSKFDPCYKATIHNTILVCRTLKQVLQEIIIVLKKILPLTKRSLIIDISF